MAKFLKFSDYHYYRRYPNFLKTVATEAAAPKTSSNSFSLFDRTPTCDDKQVQNRGIYGMKVCRYNWHSAGSLGWPFTMLKYKYISQIKHTEAINQQSETVGWFEIDKMLIAV